MKKQLLRVYNTLYEARCTLLNDIILPHIRKPKVLSAGEAITRIDQDQCSMCRFGDGEFSLIKGENLKFQSFSKKLAVELQQILRLSPEYEGLLVCIPDVFGCNDQYTPTARAYWKKYLHYKLDWIHRIIRFDKVYYDALITRFYIDYVDRAKINEKVEKLRSIWAGKKVLIVEGEKSRLGMGNDLFAGAKQIKRLICPATNAYDVIDDIEAEIESIDDFELVLIALGPTATVLVYRLYLKGYQALDIGHIDIEYEWFLRGSVKKEPVRNKYIGEIPGGDEVGETRDMLYRSQIVARVGGGTCGQ